MRRFATTAATYCLSAGLGILTATASTRADVNVGTTDDGQRVTIKVDEKPVMTYHYAGDGVVKPYVEKLFTPGGVNILRDSPSDHKHHHALMFALAVDGVNFWEERNVFGREVSRGSIAIDKRLRRVPGVFTLLGGFTSQIDWIGPARPEPMLQEERAIQVVQLIETGATLLTWRTRLSLPSGKESAAITGAEYFGLGMRFVESMDKGGKFVNADGKTGVDGTNAARSKWCAYSALADGKPVTVAMFDYPDNERHPATWFTMEKPFAYLCATLNLKKEPLTLKKPLALTYGVCLWDGTVEAEQIAKACKQWVDLLAENKPGKHAREE